MSGAVACVPYPVRFGAPRRELSRPLAARQSKYGQPDDPSTSPSLPEQWAPQSGPATAEGRARSSRNALRHGILAEDVCAGDSPDQRETFGALLDQLRAELAP